MTETTAPATGASGLTSSEAAQRLATDGPNALPAPRHPSPARHLVAEMTHFFALMLWVAGGLAIVAGMPQLGVAIFIVIVVNGVFAFVQESRAERAADRLRDLLPRRCTVVRDGRTQEIDATELVVGDVVLLDAGDRISADLRTTEAHNCRVDTSTLTGESVPVALDTDDPVHAGTFVVEGQATTVVVATGQHTRLAGIAALSQGSHRPRTPLAIELTRVVRTIAFIAVGVGFGFFGLALLVGSEARDGFLFAIGVTVALVPEGLLPTVTLSLAIGAQRMARQNALVRRLEAVETLGSTTFICTDKTGTLTENRMSVVTAWTPRGTVRIAGEGYEPSATIEGDGSARELLARAAAAGLLASSGRAEHKDGAWVARGDPMEAALHALAMRLRVDGVASDAASAIVRRFPFDPRRRRMSVTTAREVLVKGSPERVLPLCAFHDSDAANVAISDLAAQGLRLLAIASRQLDGAQPPDAGAAERDLDLLAIVGLEDPPRPHAAAAVVSCREAGMRVAMITGDHPATASAIAREIGLAGDDALVVEGSDLPDDDELLGALVDHDGIVLARIAPEQKLRIARALHSRGHVVAMTGDGVNDGPALQEADIGVAMGLSGTDVAREAADLVLLDDDFATIVVAVEQGRAAFGNLRRFLTYHLTDNVAELTPFLVWALSGGRFPLAIGVLQVLALDIGTDTLPAVALGAQAPGQGIRLEPPARGRLLDRLVARRAFGVLGPTEALFAMLAFVATFVASGWRPGHAFPEGETMLTASGAAFSAIVLGQMAAAFACRSVRRSVWQMPWTGNRLLLAAVAFECCLLAVLLGVPPIANLLDQAVPSAAGAAVAFLTPVAVACTDAVDKRLRARVSA